MATVLIHIRPGHGPIGAWRERSPRLLDVHYPGDDHRDDARTTFEALAARPDDMSMSDWMNALADRLPDTDEYETVDSDDDLTDVLAAFTRTWHGQTTSDE